MKIGAIVQARTSSTRLPGKVLKQLPYGSGITVLEHVIARLKKSKRLNEIIIATTTQRSDDEIISLSKYAKIRYYRGSKENVLSRYYFAAKDSNLDVVVRVTGDCPCVDYRLVDAIIDKHLRTKSDYTSNTIKRTFARGFDIEVFDFSALERCYKNAKNIYEKEHVTPYIYHHPSSFKITQVEANGKSQTSDIRITLDTEEDYALLCAVFDYLYEKNRFFGVKEIRALFKDKPWLKLINRHIVQKK